MTVADGSAVVRCQQHGRWVRLSDATPQRIEFPGGPVITRYRCLGPVEHFEEEDDAE